MIARLAFRELSETERNKLLEILAHHPRYQEDFVPPNDLPTAEEIQYWLIGRAGYWPDVARRQPLYHRATWHYELGPSYLLGDTSNLPVPQRPGPLPSDATLDTQELYVSQAIPLCTRILQDRNAPPADRAVALCWVAHLVADSHQPCHAGSLYMEKVFETAEGDRGANRVPTRQRKNLHALWDNLLGPDFRLAPVRRRSVEILEDAELQDFARSAREAPDATDPQAWLEESRSYVVPYVYSNEVLPELERVARGSLPEPQPISLSEDYLKAAGRVAQIRAAQASARLAIVFRQAVTP